MSTQHPQQRPAFHGTRQIVRYNWSQYLAASVVIVIALLFTTLAPLPMWLRVVLLCACAGAAYFTVASLVASWLIYDRSALARHGWINELGPAGPGRWLMLHTGLDGSSQWLRERYGAETGTVYDVYDPSLMTEPSIRRARAAGAAPPCQHVDWRRLPADTASFDTVFMIMAVHEFRTEESLRILFAEANRVLRPGGRVLLVEHLRDAANFAVFGPGFMHFWPRATWLKTATAAGFQVTSETKITRWVSALVFEKPAAEHPQKAPT